AKLVDLCLHLAQWLAALLDLHQRASYLSTEHGDIAAVAVERLGYLLAVALEQPLGLGGSRLDFAHLLHGPVVFVGLVLDQATELVDLPLEVDDLRLLGRAQSFLFVFAGDVWLVCHTLSDSPAAAR